MPAVPLRYQQGKKPWRDGIMLNNLLASFRQHLKEAIVKGDEDETLLVQSLRGSCTGDWANHITNREAVSVLGGTCSL